MRPGNTNENSNLRFLVLTDNHMGYKEKDPVLYEVNYIFLS